MTKLSYILLIVVLLNWLPSCKNDLEPMESGVFRTEREKEKPIVKTIRMSFGGDFITESDEPLLRAEDGEVFVAINVFCKEKDKANSEAQPYAYGLFSQLNEISIDLITGFTYRFETSILIERDDKLWDYGESRYGMPFSTSNGNSDFYGNEMNRFIFNGYYFTKLLDGTSVVDAKNDLPSRYGSVRYPRVKRYYGTLDDVDPSFMTEIELGMEYKSFGLKFFLENIPENTSVSVSDITNHGSLINTTNHPEYYLRFPNGLSLSSNSDASKTWEGIFSLNDLSKNSQEFKLRFFWNKGSGIVETFDHTFTVEAKKKKVLNISIEGDINETKSGNIVFTNMDDNLSDDNPEYVTNVKQSI